MKRARFVAAARREFLAEVIYYNKKQPGLGSRFTEAVKEATVRALAFPLAGSDLDTTSDALAERLKHKITPLQEVA